MTKEDSVCRGMLLPIDLILLRPAGKEDEMRKRKLVNVQRKAHSSPLVCSI